MSSLELVNGSCADQKVDAVVNAANLKHLSLTKLNMKSYWIK